MNNIFRIINKLKRVKTHKQIIKELKKARIQENKRIIQDIEFNARSLQEVD